ncbi:MAG: hypothetical protein ABI895_21480 [Deltaproteobacteria bacterium]
MDVRREQPIPHRQNGCSEACVVEAGYVCVDQDPSLCTANLCDVGSTDPACPTDPVDDGLIDANTLTSSPEAQALTERVDLNGGSGCSTSWASSESRGIWLLGALLAACAWLRRQPREPSR